MASTKGGHAGSPVRPTPVPGTTKATPVKLHFVLSARDLPRRERGVLGTTTQDPLVKVFYKSKAKNIEWIEFGVTSHVNNERNPDWLEVFEFDWIEGAGQLWHFEIWDHDSLNKNDPMGFVDVSVDTYVLLKNQELATGLSEGGSLFIKQTTPVSFRLYANDLPHLDAFDGKSDPYAECYWSHGKDGPLRIFGKTQIIKNVESADWGRIEFPNYQYGTNQHWTFKVFDKDPLPKDDVIGEAQFEVDNFVRKRAIETKPLVGGPKDSKGTITIQPASIYITPK